MLEFKQCTNGHCDIGEQQNTAKNFILKCLKCEHEQPLSNEQFCEKCGSILYWYNKPKTDYVTRMTKKFYGDIHE